MLRARRGFIGAAAHRGGVAVLDIPAEAELHEPVRIRLTGTAHEVVHGHLLVRAGRFARATVVLEHTGTSEYSEVVSVVAGDGAQITLVTVQERKLPKAAAVKRQKAYWAAALDALRAQVER